MTSEPLPAHVVSLLESLTQKETPAAALAVTRSTGPVFAHAAGKARWEGEAVPVTPETLFLLASITKPVAATALMQLVERGKLLLDDPVARFIPEFGAEGKKGVTIRHLLSHTSGLDETSVDAAWEANRSLMATEATRIASICRAPLAFPSGTMQQYCSAGYRILAELVSRLSGVEFVRYVEHQITGPLGMRDTTFKPEGTLAERAAAVAPPAWPKVDKKFRRWGMTLDEMLDDFLAFPYAGGGLWSTLDDLIKLGRSYLSSVNGGFGARAEGNGQIQPDGARATRVLSPASLRAMTRPHTTGLAEPATPSQPGPVRGLGFVLFGQGTPRTGSTEGGRDFLSPRAFGHGGSTGTMLIVDPDQDLIVVFLANHWRWSARGRDLAVNAAVAAMGA
jgi:CubicO group peptidase (beta-lactamase class C family)